MTTSPKASEEALGELHGKLASEFTKLLTGGATAAELNVIRQFLKDNGINATPVAGSPLDKLKNSLPFPSADGAKAEGETYN